ncbi:hypothetical protein PAMC26577_22245 [Caballeronia sordidicola]|uniref:Uncharacterized protein n=1 Tax=Caballeronia sordidicola TaxID=196367 RepID=A0A242MK59_CABSO|nr:hypothetical protein PAMC26577_22245 [Caballeronia sordidicola]
MAVRHSDARRVTAGTAFAAAQYAGHVTGLPQIPSYPPSQG